MFTRRDGCLIGVPTGAISSFDVLDVDPRNGGREWYEAHKSKLPATRAHRTRSGGLHLLFKHLDGLRAAQVKSRLASMSAQMAATLFGGQRLGSNSKITRRRGSRAGPMVASLDDVGAVHRPAISRQAFEKSMERQIEVW